MQQAGLATLTLLGSAQRPLAPAHAAAVTEHWPACPEETATLGTDMEGERKRVTGLQDGVQPLAGLEEGGAWPCPMMTGSLTFESQSPLVNPWAGNPCSERAVLSCRVAVQGPHSSHPYCHPPCSWLLQLSQLGLASASPSFEGHAFTCVLNSMRWKGCVTISVEPTGKLRQR